MAHDGGFAMTAIGQLLGAKRTCPGFHICRYFFQPAAADVGATPRSKIRMVERKLPAPGPLNEAAPRPLLPVSGGWRHDPLSQHICPCFVVLRPSRELQYREPP